jgi:hypothetical protein
MGPETAKRLLQALWGAFAVQVAGRFLDLQWHRSHSEFETGRDQLQAHWLVWLGTLLVIGVCATAIRRDVSRQDRRGYGVALVANALYVVVAILHFVQHLNHDEVDWTHLALAVTNAVGALGVVMVTISRMSRRDPAPTAG